MTKTILVIEDDASIATMLEDVLSGAGFEVLREADGEWGLRTFEAQRPDIVITDVLLPKLQGFDLIPKIRAVAPHVPIIVTSGVFRGRTYADDMKARFAIRAYFDKPLDVDALLEAVRTSDETPPVPRLSDPKTDEPPLLPLELKGDVADVSFGRLVGGLFARRATGALMLRRSSVKKIVYFVEGVPVFVKSNLLSECLGRVMVSERLITQDECDRSLMEKKRQTGKKQGEILVEMGSISQHNLEFALELQLQTKLFDIFGWRDGRYQFNPSTEPGGARIPLSMGPTTLIHEGASREMTPERVLADLATFMPCPVSVSRERSFRYQALQLDPRADRMIDRIDGTRTLHEVLADADFRKSDAAVVLYALVATGLLRIKLPTVSEGAMEVEALSTAEIDAIVARAKPPPPPPQSIASTEVSPPPERPGGRLLDPSGLVRRADVPPADPSLRATVDSGADAVTAPGGAGDMKVPAPDSGAGLASKWASGSKAASDSGAALGTGFGAAAGPARGAGSDAASDSAWDAGLDAASDSAWDAGSDAASDSDWDAGLDAASDSARDAGTDDSDSDSGLDAASGSDVASGSGSDVAPGLGLATASGAAPGSATASGSDAAPGLGSAPASTSGSALGSDAASALGEGSASDASLASTSGSATPSGLASASDLPSAATWGAGSDAASGSSSGRGSGSVAASSSTSLSDTGSVSETDSGLDADAAWDTSSPSDSDALLSAAIDAPRARPALGRSAPLPIPEPADDDDLRATDDRDAPRPIAARRTLPRSSSLPRSGRWRQTEEIPAAEQPSVAPPMSDDVRRKVRERLDAQMLRLAEGKKLPVRRPAPRRMAKPDNQLDFEAERRRTEQELALRYEQMQKQTWYELLRVPTDASVGAIRDAYKHTAKRLDPNRATVGSDSHAARMLAEKIYLLATRALTTLTNPEARLEYDRRLGIDDGPRIAAHFIADEAFERGKRALAVDALEDAANAFHDAYTQCPDEPLFIAYLAWVRYALRPDDAEVREQTIEVLSRVLQDAPHAEDVLAFLGDVARKHGDKPNATAAYQRLLALDPDHPEALAAMRALSPPPAKKGGLLSRYFAG